MNADLIQLVAAAADLCGKPFRHAVLVPDDSPVPLLGQDSLDCCLTLQVRDASGERCPEADLELEIYQSGNARKRLARASSGAPWSGRSQRSPVWPSIQTG